MRREQLPELRAGRARCSAPSAPKRPAATGIPRRHAGDRRRGRQGLRGARLRLPRRRTSARSAYGTTATINVMHDALRRGDRRSSRRIRPRCRGATTARCRSSAATGWCAGSRSSSATASGNAAAGSRRRARGPVRRAGRRRAARLAGPDAAAVLDARHPPSGARRQGRDHRLRRRAHARPRVPRDPRRPGLRAARRRASASRSKTGVRAHASCASPAAARSPTRRCS